MTLLLSTSSKYNKDVPKEYNMNITNSKSTNMYIFSEKDLPGYKDKIKGRQKRVNGTGGGDLKVPSNEAGGKSNSRVNKRWQPYYRKAIPSTGPARNISTYVLTNSFRTDITGRTRET